MTNKTLRPEQFQSIHDQLAPAIVEMFNREGGLQPMMLWVKLSEVDDLAVMAAGEVADRQAVERQFREGVAASMMPYIVTDLVNTAQVPAELGGGHIDAILVSGEMTVRVDGQQSDALGIWVHSAARTERNSLPISVDDSKRTCALRPMQISEAGCTGPFTMHPEAPA